MQIAILSILWVKLTLIIIQVGQEFGWALKLVYMVFLRQTWMNFKFAGNLVLSMHLSVYIRIKKESLGQYQMRVYGYDNSLKLKMP
jgi:hypothetical protein